MGQRLSFSILKRSNHFVVKNKMRYVMYILQALPKTTLPSHNIILTTLVPFLFLFLCLKKSLPTKVVKNFPKTKDWIL